MKISKKQLESGESLIEPVIAIGIFGTVLIPFILSVSNLIFSQAGYTSRIQASHYAREELEITYNIAVNTDSWEDFASNYLGSFYPRVGGEGLELVELVGAEEEFIEGSGGIFTRKINIAKAWRDNDTGEIVAEGTNSWEDTNTLEVISKVSWQERGIPQRVELTTYLINFVSPTAASPSPSPSPSPKPWWDVTWAKRRKITFNNTNQSENLANFPVLVKLNQPSRIDYDSTQNNGQDLRFVDADGTTLLNYEIEAWNESGDSYVWVKVPQIDGSSGSDYMWMYYGKPSASSGQVPEGVWDGNFKMVQHLQETSGTHYDSTANNNDGTPQNGVNQNVSGKISVADDFDGSDDYVDLGSSASLRLNTGGAVEAWVYPRSAGEGAFGRIVDKSSGIDANNGYALQMGNNPRIVPELDGDYLYSANGSVAYNQWTYLVWTFDGAYWKIYTNGDLNRSDSKSSLPTNVSVGVRIGNRAGATDRTFDGRIDEVRLSNTARSADWIAAQYNSMMDVFASFGSEESY